MGQPKGRKLFSTTNRISVENFMSIQRVFCSFAVALVLVVASSVWASTGNFTGPLTSGVILSVDINGGTNTSNARPTEGWNGLTSGPTKFADQYGVTWTPWGGAVVPYFGDGTNWPQDQSGQVGTAAVNGGDNKTTFTKNFTGASVTVSAPGTTASYTTYNSGTIFKSRDRGIAGNYNGGGAGPNTTAATIDSDMFTDLVFAGGSGSNVQSTSFLKVGFSGLTAGQLYKVALYSYDSSGGHSENWTATAPTTELGVIGWFDAGTNNFHAPGDEQTITWTAGTEPAPAVFTLAADGGGNLAVWGWGGNGVTGSQGSDTSYLNGFQIALAVPEASAFAMGGAVCGMIGLTYIARRNRKEQAAA
jgi:hypothetical protein